MTFSTTVASSDIAFRSTPFFVRVLALRDWLLGQSARIEAARRIPDDVMVRLHEEGLFRMTLPPRLGGAGLEPAQAWQVVLELARGSGSVAWLVSLCAANLVMLTRFSDRLQRELFEAQPHVVVSALTGAAPRGLKVEPVDGGVRVSGQWGYASGVDVANWVGLLLPIGDAGEVHFALVPQREFAIDAQSWNVLGMRGTGSKDVSLDAVFVPAHRLTAWKPIQEGGRHPECSQVEEVHGYPLNPLFAMSILAPSLGLAAAVVDEFHGMAGRRVRNAAEPVREPFITTELAQASATISMACDSLIAEAARPMAALRAQRTLSLQERAESRVRIVVIARAARLAAQQLFSAAGGQILPSGLRFEALFRDFNAMYSHLLLQPQPISEACGRLQLGLDVPAGVRV